MHSSNENVEILIDYLKNIGGKPLTVSCRRQNAFKTNWEERELKLRNRCHIQNAVEYLHAIKEDCSHSQIKVVIADITRYVSVLDDNEDASFILISTNTLPSAIHFDAAKRLFLTHQIRDQNQNNYNTDLLSVYALRLALENRVRGLLGIDYATNKGQIIGLNTFIKISKTLKSVRYSEMLNWTEVEWINSWVNHHMHRHLRPYPWIIHQAFESLQSFINPQEPILIEERSTYSFYSATCVPNEDEFHEEIGRALKIEYPDIQITWLNKREIMK